MDIDYENTSMEEEDEGNGSQEVIDADDESIPPNEDNTMDSASAHGFADDDDDIDIDDLGGEEDSSSPSRKRKSRDEEDEDEDGLKGLGFHMAISQEERQRALALRAAVAEGDDTRDIPIPDMEFVQYAIIVGDDIPKSLERIRKIHQFRTQYQINDTVEQGVESIRGFMDQQPGFSLNIDQCARQKHYVHVLDFAKFNPKKIHLPNDWKIFFRGIYYFVLALNPTLSAVRNGVLGILECDGMGFHNFCIEFERRLWYEHPSAYPFRFHELSWVRTPLVANVFHSLMKPIMPEEFRNSIHLGVTFDESFDGRLDTLFLQPSFEIANERQVMTAKSFLEKRFHNASHFKL